MYQSVRSIATYMAARAKITWNQEYLKMLELKQRESSRTAYVIASAKTLVISGFTRLVFAVLPCLLVQGRRRYSTKAPLQHEFQMEKQLLTRLGQLPIWLDTLVTLSFLAAT
jgi:hypothetical protein